MYSAEIVFGTSLALLGQFFGKKKTFPNNLPQLLYKILSKKKKKNDLVIKPTRTQTRHLHTKRYLRLQIRFYSK